VRDERRDQKEIDRGGKSADLHRKLVQESNGAGQKLEGEQERRGEDERKEGRRRRSSKAGAKTEPATTSSVPEEATIASAGNNRACSDGRSGENKRGSRERTGGRIGYGGSSETVPLCNGGRQGEELLCLQRIWAYGL